MEKPFNKLSNSELERLSILAEECGEVIHIVGKILRHGYNSNHPDYYTTNRELLEKELGHVAFISTYMDEKGDINTNNIRDQKRLKNMKIGEYLHHQDIDKQRTNTR